MANINPYINFNGNTEEAFLFYKSVFGGEFVNIIRFKELFNGLSAGGTIEMPIGDSPWGSYFGMFRDKYGIEWTVDYDPKYKGKV
jgi:uncharacterized glyoxalase superfamily protein PhnB